MHKSSSGLLGSERERFMNMSPAELMSASNPYDDLLSSDTSGPLPGLIASSPVIPASPNEPSSSGNRLAPPPPPPPPCRSVSTLRQVVESIFHPGMVVQVSSTVSRRSGYTTSNVNIAELQLLDSEAKYLVRKGFVGRVLRAAQYTVLIEFLVSESEYKEMQEEAGERVAKSWGQNGSSSSPLDIGTCYEPGSPVATTYVIPQASVKLDPESPHQVSDSSHMMMDAISDLEFPIRPGDDSTGAPRSSGPVGDNLTDGGYSHSPPTESQCDRQRKEVPVGASSSETLQQWRETIIMQKTFPHSHVQSVSSMVESHRQEGIRQQFKQKSWAVAAERCLSLISDICQTEGLELTDSSIQRSRVELNATDELSPLLLADFPSFLKGVTETYTSCLPSVLSRLAELHQKAFLETLSWLHMTLCWCCVHQEKYAEAHSAAKRAVTLDDQALCGYVAGIFSFHASGDLKQSRILVEKAEELCSEASCNTSPSFRSARIQDELYGTFTHRLLNVCPSKARMPVVPEIEVIVPGLKEGDFSYLSLVALRRFTEGEAIFREVPSLWIPISEFTQSIASTPMATGGGIAMIPITPVIAPCDQCGFDVVERKVAASVLKEEQFSHFAKIFLERYPVRTAVFCRNRCGKAFCSEVCEHRAWAGWHCIECSRGQYMTPERSFIFRSQFDQSGTVVAAAAKLFYRAVCMFLADVLNQLAGKDNNPPPSEKIVQHAQDAKKRLVETIPILLRFPHPPSRPPVLLSVILETLSATSPVLETALTVFSPLVTPIYRHCLLTHKIIDRCPIETVLAAAPRNSEWKNVRQRLSSKRICLFPVMGSALTAAQRTMAELSALAPMTSGTTLSPADPSIAAAPPHPGTGPCLFSLYGGAGELSISSDIGSQEGESLDDMEEEYNVTIEATSDDPEGISFTMFCSSERGIDEGEELRGFDPRAR